MHQSIIRQAILSDSINLAALSIQVWLHTYASKGIRQEISSYVFSNFSKGSFDNRITDSKYRIYVFIQQAHLVGYIMANLESFWQDESNGYEIEKLYIQENFQKMGIGSQLLSELASRHGERFWLSSWAHNHNAITFYKNFGFIDIGHTYFQLDENELHENRILAFKSTPSTRRSPPPPLSN